MPKLRKDLEFGKTYGGLEFKLWNKDLVGKEVSIISRMHVFQLGTEWYRIHEDLHTISREMLQ